MCQSHLSELSHLMGIHKIFIWLASYIHIQALFFIINMSLVFLNTLMCFHILIMFFSYSTYTLQRDSKGEK